MKTICIIGLGYIGLPTALIAAQHGMDVIGFDIDEQKVAAINTGRSTFEEPEIEHYIQKIASRSNFHATTRIIQADCFIITVPTPFTRNNTADLSYVWSAAKTLCSVLTPGNTIILESTVPVGTTEKLAAYISDTSGLQVGTDIFIAHCPERVLPGKIFYELVHNSRIIGGVDEASTKQAKQFYAQFVKGELHLTSAPVAELIKLIENSSRDVAIAFANQVASMASELNVNPFEVIELANKHPRVNILNPSCGVGGHCIAIDPWFLVESFPEHTHLIKAARSVNNNKPNQVVKKITDLMTTHPNKLNTKVLLLGLTYKPNIDDLRESPALDIARQVSGKHCATILLHDPYVSPEYVEKNIKNAHYISCDAGLQQADIIVSLVNHDAYHHITPTQIKNKIVLDVCGLFYHNTQHAQSSKLFPAQKFSSYSQHTSTTETRS